MLGTKLKEARREAGYSLDQLARETTFAASVIARWERGVHEPRFENLCVLARVLGKPLEFFCPGEDDEAAA